MTTLLRDNRTLLIMTGFSPLFLLEGFPQELRSPNLVRGETEQRQHGNLVATVWNDSNYVYILSTNSNPVGDGPVCRRSRGGRCQEFLRPPPVESYQKLMAGVDRANHRSKNPVGHPSKKYWKFFFNFILEICLTNAFLIFCRTPGNNDKYDLLDFRLDIANQLINNFSCRKRKIPTENPVGGPLHEQVRFDRPKSTCKWCPQFGEKKRKETVKGCSLCNVHLCSIVLIEHKSTKHDLALVSLLVLMKF
ncbi:hypothetical protein KUTeg_000931 [Tegillarca granosa]|uniref:PiggyBac transposable element-derived protein domain-containing protein n=1 Tax=Tegillarca granosa TaxID=220873 RepID=A0ABQ9FW94_TEGGR|nr:hypothetical protein KUTeg_000931 [Tegillarca granosa]